MTGSHVDLSDAEARAYEQQIVKLLQERAAWWAEQPPRLQPGELESVELRGTRPDTEIVFRFSRLGNFEGVQRNAARSKTGAVVCRLWQTGYPESVVEYTGELTSPAEVCGRHLGGLDRRQPATGAELNAHLQCSITVLLSPARKATDPGSGDKRLHPALLRFDHCDTVDARSKRRLRGTNRDTRDPLAAWWRLALVLVASIVLPLALVAWILVAWLWFGLREGENVVCHCWADDHGAWQYTGQFVLAWIGVTAGTLAVVIFLRRAWRLFPSASSQRRSLWGVATGIGVLALAAWIAFYLTGTTR